MAIKKSKGATPAAAVSARIPFEEAVGEASLLKARFDELSLAQKAHLKTLYGCSLDSFERDAFGLSELDYWSVGQGGAETDELGYVRSIREQIPYATKKFREAWIIGGRRLGKTDAFASTIVAYEAALGGHEAYVRKGQQAIVFQIAQDLRMARYSLHFIRATLESSPLLAREIVAVTADRIDLRNGLSIVCVPPTLKSVRGFASPVAVLDEVGVWYQDSDSANPDYEIYRAVLPAQLQFPDAKIVGISSPWNKSGLLYRYFEGGTDGRKLHSSQSRDEFRDVLVIHSPTAAVGNPQVTYQYLEQQRDRDPRAFAREFLAEFQDSISGFLPPELVEKARSTGVVERPPSAEHRYVAAIDPAFKRDAFALTIVHRERDGRLVQDAVRRFVRPPGAPPINPQAVCQTIAPLLRAYGCRYVYSDQYQLESFRQLLREEARLEVLEVTFTAKRKAELYGNLQQLFFQQRISLLDDFETVKELKALERELTGGGQVHIGAPPGMHDDMATVLALAAAHAMHLGPQEKPASASSPEPSIHERIVAQIAARRQDGGEATWTWD